MRLILMISSMSCISLRPQNQALERNLEVLAPSSWEMGFYFDSDSPREGLISETIGSLEKVSRRLLTGTGMADSACHGF